MASEPTLSDENSSVGQPVPSVIFGDGLPAIVSQTLSPAPLRDNRDIAIGCPCFQRSADATANALPLGCCFSVRFSTLLAGPTFLDLYVCEADGFPLRADRSGSAAHSVRLGSDASSHDFVVPEIGDFLVGSGGACPE